ncbi:glycosyltransferase [Gemella sp.]
MSKKYFIYEEFGSDSTAATKAPNDLQEIFKKNKFLELVKIRKEVSKNKKYISVLKNILISVSKLKKGDVIIFQFPFATNNKFKKILLKLCRYKAVKTIFLMNDLESLRYNKDAAKIIDKEKYIDLADVIICHNNSMRNYLISSGINADKLVELEIFDYLVDLNINEKKLVKPTEITIAGNLSEIKSGYIYELIKKIRNVNINLYGPNFNPREKLGEHIIYKGSISPDRLPLEISGDYGLIWDGDSISTCSGITGNYLRYNNPHKTSLFLVSGIPIIVWTNSAMKEFVEKKGVGLVIDDLNELENTILKVSEEQYSAMKRNVESMSLQLRKGYYTTNAINKALDKIDNIRK